MRLTAGTDRGLLIGSWWRRLRWPLVAGITLVIHLAVMRSLGFSLQFRYGYARGAVAVAVIIAGVLCWRLVSLSFQHAGLVALRHGRAGTRTLLLLAERIAKVMLTLVAVFGLLAIAGLDLTTALAGVGIVGVAIAFGAQKTVENLLGGVFLLTDRVIAVGDYCRLSDREGWIEDITLRSVRLRTLQQTLLSVPAGVLSQGSIENYSSRGKILIQTRLRLRYGVTVDQLRRVLDGIRKVVADDGRIDQTSARVRLVDFSGTGVEIEVFAFVETGDVLQFLEVREQVLLRVAAVVESTGGAFAAPPQFIYGAQEVGDKPMTAVAKPS
jgi:MscS family membrane protein